MPERRIWPSRNSGNGYVDGEKEILCLTGEDQGGCLSSEISCGRMLCSWEAQQRGSSFQISAAPEVRSTLDVDIIVKVATRSDYYRLEASLRKLGFDQPTETGTPICRWKVSGILVDVMPTDTRILGFSNRFYDEAIENAEKVCIDEGLEINLVTPSFFLATKIEAFHGRGNGDYLGSHDMEDIVTLIDGREEIVLGGQFAVCGIEIISFKKLQGLLGRSQIPRSPFGASPSRCDKPGQGSAGTESNKRYRSVGRTNGGQRPCQSELRFSVTNMQFVRRSEIVHSSSSHVVSGCLACMQRITLLAISIGVPFREA